MDGVIMLHYDLLKWKSSGSTYLDAQKGTVSSCAPAPEGYADESNCI
jgi:hypothetical protein